MLASYFENRRARIIAMLRLVLAITFLIALIADPTQPYRAPLAGYALLWAYAAFAAVMFRVAWTSWWLDFRLSAAAFAVDVAVFSMSVWFTEGGSGSFSSPFMAFFFFVMFSASLRWNSKITALSAVGATLAYLLAGVALMAVDRFVDLQVFLRRLSYMGVMAIAFVFVGFQSRRARRDSLPSDLVEFEALEAAVRFAAQRLSAGTVAISWEERDEPSRLAIVTDGVFEMKRPPSTLAAPECELCLFDIARGRMLVKLRDSDRISAIHGRFELPLAREIGVIEGLSATLQSGAGATGQLVVGDMPNFAFDDLDRVRDVAQEVVMIIEERALAELERNRAIIQTREALARDLHDSVAQALAGASFGIEALRQTIPPEAEEPRRLASELKATLRREQAHIREMIDRLRLAPSDNHLAELPAELAMVVGECRQRWGIDIALQVEDGIRIEAPLAFECRQIVREAVSNAVRHGRAGRVDIIASSDGARLSLDIGNDGAPFGDKAEDAQPWSIRQRVVRLNGEMLVGSTGSQPNLKISLPIARVEP